MIYACFDTDIALDDEGLAQAAQIKKLEHIYIAACHQVTAEGLLAISWRDKLQVSDGDMQDEEGLAELFTEAERKAYEDARTYKIMKNRISLDSPELQAPIHALLEFFDGMNQWERMADQKGDGSQADIDALFARQVSWTPRPGWRPVHLCWERGGTYTGHHLVAGERVTKNKFWLYTEKQISLFNENNKPVFSSVIVVTDRTVLDAQLQETISGFDHKLGAIETIGEDKTSQHLKNAINDGVRIIVTTLQKFPVIYTEIDKANGRYRRSPKRVCGARGISGGRS